MDLAKKKVQKPPLCVINMFNILNIKIIQNIYRLGIFKTALKKLVKYFQKRILTNKSCIEIPSCIIIKLH